MKPVLEVQSLTIGYRSRTGDVAVVVSDVGFALYAGRILGLAGESGCGKSTAALAAIGYRARASVRLRGAALFGGFDLLQTTPARLREVWGREIAYVAQDAAATLNPQRRIAWLLAEPLTLHLGLSGKPLRRRSLALLEDVGLPDPELALHRYPHQFSGGQQQRVALAIAMACEPKVLVLDEPTTGLDVTTQAQISKLVAALVEEHGTAALSISHDLALLATVCDDIAIMYAGEVVERGSALDIYERPRHPYAAALIDAVPRVDEAVTVVGVPGLPPPEVVLDSCPYADRCRFVAEACRAAHPPLEEVVPGHAVRCVRLAELPATVSQRRPIERAGARRGEPLLRVEDLRCTYRGRHATVAVDGVSFEVAPGETLGLVGESGSGKSTALRAVAGLHAPAGGRITFEGQSLAPRAVRRPRPLRRAIQLVFQNPDLSLNPRHTVATIVTRPLALFAPDLRGVERRRRILALLGDVRLDPLVLAKYPHQLSGGQKQRVALARAFAADPKLILCDEVVSALDVSVQASILELLGRLARERETALLFVTHDLAVVRSIADRICVLRDGKVQEAGPTEQIFTTPQHPYTRELLAAVPRPRAAAFA